MLYGEIYYTTKPWGGSWTIPVKFTDTGTKESGYPAMIVDDENNLHVVWSENYYDLEIYYRSKSSGGGWSSAVNISDTSGNSRQPSVTVDNGGNLHVVWSDDAALNNEIYYTTKPSGGDWSTPINISNNPSYSYYPLIVADKEDNVHVVWRDQDVFNGDTDIYYTVKANLGHWPRPANISNNTGNSDYPAITVNNENTLHIAWSDYTTGNWETQHSSKSADGIWSTPDNVSNEPGSSRYPAIAVDGENTPHVMWMNWISDVNAIYYASTPSSELTPTLTSIDINGPATGIVSQTYTFTATVNPTATTPITYTWQATGQSPVVHMGSLNRTDAVTFNWSITGTQIITVTAANAAGTVSDTHTIISSALPPDCPHPLTDVSISGSASGYTGASHTFTSTVTPPNATTPITYTWSPASDSGQGTNSASYEWSDPGIYTITLMVENCTPPSTVTVSDTHAIVISAPPPAGDPHEPDDTCEEASSITTDGSVQFHTFHIPGDADWVSFQVISGTEYLVEALTPVTSTADMVLEIYDACAALPVDSQGYVFSPDVRLQFKAPSTGIYYLHLFNQYSDVAGTDVAYHLSVRALGDEPTPGALVLVAGRYRPNDSLQRNIHNVTNAVYRLFQDNGYNSDRIYYLATSLNLDADDDSWPDVDAYVSRTTLEQAITEWAVEKVGPDRAFTLYFMDHGSPDLFYLDGPNETVSPDDVNGWLNTLEAAAPGVKVNVIVEACHAGSFVDNLAKNGRVVIASTRATAPAWSSPEGAIFSDAFVDALSRGMSLYGSFEDGKGATRAHGQTPWLDDDGDGKPNRAQDGQEAARRGFAYAGTLAGPEKWPPYVVWAEVGPVQEGAGVITAEVLDDKNVLSAWAVIYKPSYTPPEPGPEMVQETLPTVMLFDQDGDDVYTGLYENFDELGGYRVVVYAVDGEGFEGRPREVAVRTGWLLYLPTVMRQ
jgi:hypothetical protein